MKQLRHYADIERDVDMRPMLFATLVCGVILCSIGVGLTVLIYYSNPLTHLDLWGWLFGWITFVIGVRAAYVAIGSPTHKTTVEHVIITRHEDR